MPPSPRTGRAPLPDRPPLRPAAYLESLKASAAAPPRRGLAALGTGALVVGVAVAIAAVLAITTAVAWLTITKMTS